MKIRKTRIRKTKDMMQIYLAPMEGITGYIVRNAFARHFGQIDKYFTPFIPAAKRMNYKILRDLAPENNQGIRLVPQLISNQSEEVLHMIGQLKDLGYRECNLNLGCPSGTVVSKKRGSGLLLYPDELDRMLDGIFQKADIPISVKTRIGFESLEEWPALLDLFRRYPLCELIIHPRLRKEQYAGVPHLEEFEKAYRLWTQTEQDGAGEDSADCGMQTGRGHAGEDSADCGMQTGQDGAGEDSADCGMRAERGHAGEDSADCGMRAERGHASEDSADRGMQADRSTGAVSGAKWNRLVYNGDIWNESSFQKIHSEFPLLQTVMIGRGLLACPDLCCRIKGVPMADVRKSLRAFCDDIYNGYAAVFDGEKDVVMHMKEIWTNLGLRFKDSRKLVKKLLKTNSPSEYKILVNQIFETLELV